MDRNIVLLLIGAALGVLLFLGKDALRHWRLERAARARLDSYVPRRPEIPLSRQDRRGWVTGRDGVMRPR